MGGIYIAGRYPRREELLEYAGQLRNAGHTVTARWLSMHADGPLPRTLEAEQVSIPESAWRFATSDWNDTNLAETLIAFAEPLGAAAHAARGGRHVEFGWAQQWGKRLVVIGGAENAAHALPGVQHVPAWDLPAVLRALEEPHTTDALEGSERARRSPSGVYLTGRPARREEMLARGRELTSAGHPVTARWLSAAPQRTGDELSEPGHARSRREDVGRANTLIAFTEHPLASRSSDGGLRHVEFGWAQAQGARLILIGPRENIMHCLPEVERLPEWDLRQVLAAVAREDAPAGATGKGRERSG